jgi:hypothetical protein
MKLPAIVYWERHRDDTRPAEQAIWGWETDAYNGPIRYISGKQVEEAFLRLRTNNSMWNKYGPFNAMRYYQRSDQ